MLRTQFEANVFGFGIEYVRVRTIRCMRVCNCRS